MDRMLMRKELTGIFEKMGFDNISGIITEVKNIFNDCSFESNSNYIICGRREFLIEESLGIINGDENYFESSKSINDRLRFVVGNIYELTYGDAYPYTYRHEKRKIIDGSEMAKLRDIDFLYSKNGIVCLEEKNIIEDLIIKLEMLYKSL